MSCRSAGLGKGESLMGNVIGDRAPFIPMVKSRSNAPCEENKAGQSQLRPMIRGNSQSEPSHRDMIRSPIMKGPGAPMIKMDEIKEKIQKIQQMKSNESGSQDDRMKYGCPLLALPDPVAEANEANEQSQQVVP